MINPRIWVTMTDVDKKAITEFLDWLDSQARIATPESIHTVAFYGQQITNLRDALYALYILIRNEPPIEN